MFGNRYTTKLFVYGVLSTILTASISIGIGRYIGIEEGRKEGVRDYHALCFFGPRIMIDNENGFTVSCGPLGKIPREELENYKGGI